MILIVDNYDSFTFNLYQMLGALSPDIEVLRNDAVTVQQIRERAYAGVVLSPGPGAPDESGVCLDIIKELSGELPLLGVCLGHQAICQIHGATVVRAKLPVHGKPSDVQHDGSGLFAGLPQPMVCGRYHSLVVAPSTMPSTLQVTATTADGEIMGVRHREYPTYGVQFHPESVLTPHGEQLLANFLAVVG
ncbi:MAG: aminodeoxychorismate/anthranilate synthase component II [Deltaproteobacteria bacterium]|nr:aminodeoxychorismate/anthranilate synthase component II [Deltaproteobacteria bacterium]